jgi:hypothetical protein
MLTDIADALVWTMLALLVLLDSTLGGVLHAG